MTVHLVKMAVGIDDLAHLAAVQARRLAGAAATPGSRGGKPAVRHHTRHMPRRAAEILDGGSIFWVVKGAIRARQRILGLERRIDSQGRRFCELRLDPELVATVPRPCRPFQGWRYLERGAAPPDLEAAPRETGAMPPDLAAELRALGLL